MSTLESPAPADRPIRSTAGGGDVLGVRIAAALVDVAILLALFPVVGVATGWSGELLVDAEIEAEGLQAARAR